MRTIEVMTMKEYKETNARVKDHKTPTKVVYKSKDMNKTIYTHWNVTAQAKNEVLFPDAQPKQTNMPKERTRETTVMERLGAFADTVQTWYAKDSKQANEIASGLIKQRESDYFGTSYNDKKTEMYIHDQQETIIGVIYIYTHNYCGLSRVL